MVTCGRGIVRFASQSPSVLPRRQRRRARRHAPDRMDRADRPDLSGGAKALWFLFVLFIPLIGVVVYLIARGGSMNERSVW